MFSNHCIFLRVLAFLAKIFVIIKNKKYKIDKKFTYMLFEDTNELKSLIKTQFKTLNFSSSFSSTATLRVFGKRNFLFKRNVR